MAPILTAFKKIDDVNMGTKSNISVYQGKIQDAVESLCKLHNTSVMATHSKKRKAMLEEIVAPAPPPSKPNKRRLTLNAAADLEHDVAFSPAALITSNPKPSRSPVLPPS